jgi:hypothetical protein
MTTEPGGKVGIQIVDVRSAAPFLIRCSHGRAPFISSECHWSPGQSLPPSQPESKKLDVIAISEFEHRTPCSRSDSSYLLMSSIKCPAAAIQGANREMNHWMQCTYSAIQMILQFQLNLVAPADCMTARQDSGSCVPASLARHLQAPRS